MPLFRRKQSVNNKLSVKKSAEDRVPRLSIGQQKQQQQHVCISSKNNKKDASKKRSSTSRMRLSWFMRGSRNTTTPKTQENASFFDDDHSSLSSQDNAESGRDDCGSKSILKIATQEESLGAVWQPCRRHCGTLEIDTASSTPQATNSLPVSLGKYVRFSEAIIHVHEIILGDCPTVSCGAPLALGNCLQGHEMILDISDEDEESVILEEYHFPETPNNRSLASPYIPHANTNASPYLMSPPTCTIHEHKSHKQLWIPEAERTERLLEWGYKEEDIQRVMLFHTLTRMQEELVGHYQTKRKH